MEVRELFMIFVRVDKTKSGFVSMPEYVYFLNKGKKADPTGFLAKVVQFFSKSVDESRLQGFRHPPATHQRRAPLKAGDRVRNDCGTIW